MSKSKSKSMSKSMIETRSERLGAKAMNDSCTRWRPGKAYHESI